MSNFDEIARISESPETALVALHEAGASPVHAIKALRNGRGLSLVESKKMLMESPAWFAEAEAANRLHDEIEELEEEIDSNQRILDWIEERGGGYVWEPEVFAVTLLEADIGDSDAERISRLVGVQQIAVDASKASIEGLRMLAHISGLQSLVLENSRLTEVEVAQLRAIGPKVELIE